MYVPLPCWAPRTLTSCIALSTLVVDPAFQRRGAGALLVQDGITRAHAAGFPLFTGGSSSGARLYERLGFVRQETMYYTRAKIPAAILIKEIP